MEKKLKETNLITILLNHDVLKINNDSNNINSIIVNNRESNTQFNISGNKYILAIPPKPINKLLINSPSVQDAFGPINQLTKWSENNSYFDYIPVTLHWKNKIELPKIWGFPASDWGLAFIVLSNYMTFNSNDSQTVISTCITFTDRKSTITNKTADESDISEIYTEVLRQLKLSYPDLPNPDKMLVSPNVYKNNNKWVNIDTAYVITNRSELLPFKSELFTNLYNCGAHNGNSNYYFTSIETAVSNAQFLSNKLEPKLNLRLKHTAQISNFIYFSFLILIVLIYVKLFGKVIW